MMYSKKAIAGFVSMMMVITVMILFAVTDIRITDKTLGICFFVMVALTSIASLILAILAMIECKKDEELKGALLAMITMLLFVLFVIFTVVAMTTTPVPAPKPTCEVRGGQCKSICDLDQRKIDGVCPNNLICCGIPRSG